ncbi:MAG: hypothetical protein ACYC54_08940 [Sedimentisphaerales bacterium]
MMNQNKYQIYSDESGNERFRSVGVLSGEKSQLDKLKIDLYLILKLNQIASIEFKDIKGDSKRRKAAIEFIEKGILLCFGKSIRIDILTWDTQDQRHSVIGRDDKQNLQIMYYKLVRWVKECWKSETLDWNFYPDENSAIDWQELIRFIQNTNLSKNNKYELTLFGLVKNLHFPRVENHQQIVSTDEPLVQLIDIFTGFVRFSFEQGKKYLQWIKWKEQQNNRMLINTVEEPDTSKNIIAKYEVLEPMIVLCKQMKMGVSINTNCYLKTFDYKRSLNFWKYEVQTPKDQAPVKIKEYVPKTKLIIAKPVSHMPE